MWMTSSNTLMSGIPEQLWAERQGPGEVVPSQPQASRYIYYIPSNIKYFKYLREACYTCRKISQRRGRDVITPVRSIGLSNMVEGVSLMVDTFGLYILRTKPTMSATREATRTRRDTVKLYVMLWVCMYSHHVSAAVLDSMDTGSLVIGLRCMMLEHGWQKRKLAVLWFQQPLPRPRQP